MTPEERTEVLHTMRNIAQKFAFIESLQDTQRSMMKTLKGDWDNVFKILDERKKNRNP